MRIVIEAADFRRLSAGTQSELLELLAGKRIAEVAKTAKKPSVSWRQPVDLTPGLAVKLLHGLAENHRRRLELFARKGGRVSMKALLAVTRDTDLRVLSYFQGAVSRKLRRLVGDQTKQAQLLGWDYESTKWDKEHKHIINGIYYVTDKTAKALKAYFDAN